MNVENYACRICGNIFHDNDSLIPDKNNSEHVWYASRIPRMDRFYTPNDD